MSALLWLIKVLLWGVTLVAMGVYAKAWWNSRKAWSVLAERAGFDWAWWSGLRTLRGNCLGMTVEFGRSFDRVSLKRVTIPCHQLSRPGVLLLHAKAVDVRALVSRESVKTGDSAFDEVAFIRGPERYWRAVLNERTRAAVVEALHVGAQFSVGEASFKWNAFPDADAVLPRIHSVIRAVTALELYDSQIPERLASIATTDPVPEVRFGALFLLSTDFPTTPEFSDALSRALSDPSAELRLLAARQVGNEAATRTLDSLVRDVEARADLRAEALQLLVTRSEREVVASLVSVALGSPEELLRAAGINALVFTQGELSREALVERLRHDKSVVVQVTCIGPLGHFGDKAAVEALHLIAETTLSAQGKADALLAIRNIQSRLGHGGAGHVSFAQGSFDEGAVSVSADAGSVSEIPDGRTKVN